jgi:hypothetical protein
MIQHPLRSHMLFADICSCVQRRLSCLLSGQELASTLQSSDSANNQPGCYFFTGKITLARKAILRIQQCSWLEQYLVAVIESKGARKRILKTPPLRMSL